MLLTTHKVLPVLECLDLEGGERLGQCHILVLTACLAAATLTLWVSHADRRQDELRIYGQLRQSMLGA